MLGQKPYISQEKLSKHLNAYNYFDMITAYSWECIPLNAYAHTAFKKSGKIGN